MTIWLATVLLLMPPLALPIAVALRGTASQRLVAVQLASGLTAFALAATSFAFDETSFIDLALCVTFLAVPGTFLMALFYERWL